ncbi:MAG: penicillin-binding transpeptidase domain-containing protein [Lachnospiraceae bacterium]|nr:penicillin-binding transpeptidase domain-containing protein [Lachnospiraceae bacterium]
MSKKKKRRPAPRKVARYIKFRTGLVFLVVLGLMSFLILRIIVISKNDGEDYNKTILSQMSYDSRVIQAERGKIMDRNGTSLAYNENRYNLILEPKNILEDEADKEVTLTALEKCYGYDRKEIEERLKANPNSYYDRYKNQISEKAMQKFLDYTEEYNNAKDTEQESASEPETKADTEDKKSDSSFLGRIKGLFSDDDDSDKEEKKRGKIKGVYFEKNQKRVYPYKSLASTTIGFANSAGGVTGLESYYNDLLKGTDGRRFGYLNEESSVDVQTIEETDGYSLVTTLSSYIQKVCEDVINRYEKKTGSNVTSIMVMNPNNGEIYAMSESRQFNLQKPDDLTSYYSEKELKKMSRKQKSEALLQIWRNFCTSTSYEPGSTAKVFTVAAGLEEDRLKQNDTFVCDGVGVYGGCRIHCHKRSGHGSLNVMGALMASCNDALMLMGDKIGTEIFCDYQSKFNFGRLTGVDLPDEFSCSNQIYHADNMTSVDLATNSFGQNFYVTMVQMCAAYASLVNGGNYYEPHVVKQILDGDGNVLENVEPKLVRQTVSKNTSEFMKEALLQTVENGTGNRIKIEGYEIGGKTGTAEKADVGAAEETYTVSFMSVAPAYDPEVIVYVVVDEPNCTKAENTYQAKDLCKEVLEKILPYLNIYPTADEDSVSNANGDFTDPEDDEMYDEDTPIIETPQQIKDAERIRKEAEKAQNKNKTEDKNKTESKNKNKTESKNKTGN